MQAKDTNLYTDEQLLTRFYQNQDNEWLGILLPRYTLLLLGVCMKYLKNEEDARDAVQQVYLKVIDELHKYEVQYFKSWIYMIAKNHCLMKLRDRKYHVTEIREMHATTPAEEADIGAYLKKDVLLDKLTEGVQSLNEEQRRCVNLFYLDKKSYQEVADITGYTMLQVKSYIQNGKRNLRIMLQNESK